VGCYVRETNPKSVKDINQRVSAAVEAVAVAVESPCVGAADSGLPDRAPAAKPDGMRSNRNAAATRPRRP
jgi:hypothetical protein